MQKIFLAAFFKWYYSELEKTLGKNPTKPKQWNSRPFGLFLGAEVNMQRSGLNELFTSVVHRT